MPCRCGVVQIKDRNGKYKEHDMQNFYAPHLLVRGGRYSASGYSGRDTVFDDLRYMDGGRQTYGRYWRENEIVIYGATLKGYKTGEKGI